MQGESFLLRLALGMNPRYRFTELFDKVLSIRLAILVLCLVGRHDSNVIGLRSVSRCGCLALHIISMLVLRDDGIDLSPLRQQCLLILQSLLHIGIGCSRVH